MKQKTELKLYKGKGFSTIEQSPLGQMLKLLEIKLNDILMKDEQKGNNPSLEHQYSLKQLKLIQNNLGDVNTLLEAFSKGDGPGATSFGFGASAYNLSDVVEESTEFFSSEYAAFIVIEKALDDAISESLKQTKIQKITKENKEFFINSLKKELRKGSRDRFDLAKSIPGCNLDKFFIDLDLAIDESLKYSNEISKTNEETLVQVLKSSLSTSLSNILFGHLTPYGEYISGKYKQVQLKIVDPIIYDFAVSALELLTIAPKEFKDLVPFFNPPIITQGILPTIVSKIFSVEIKNNTLKSPNKNETNEINYTYKITGKDIDLTIDVAAEYNKHIDKVINTLALAVAKYYVDYAHTTHVKNELAKGEPDSDLVKKFIEPRADLIKKFMIKEKELEAKCIATLQNSLDLDFKISDESSVEENIIYLNSIVDLLLSSQKDFVNLQTRKANYDKTPVKALMEKNGLANPLYYAKEAGLDLSLPLTKIVITKNSVDKYEPVALATLQQIGEAVIEQNKKVDAKINEVKAQIKLEVQKWCVKEIAIHEKNNLVFISQLNELLQNTIFEIHPFAGNAEERMAAIQRQIELLDGKIATLPDSIEIAKNMQIEFNQPAKCTKELVELDFNIPKVADECYRSSREQAKTTIEQLNGLRKVFETQKEQLMAELSKAKSDKALNEMMATANPAPVIELINIKETSKNELELSFKALSEKLVQMEAELKESDFDLKLGRRTDPLQNTDPLEIFRIKLTNTQSIAMKNLSSNMMQVLEKFSVKAPEIVSEENLSTLDGSKQASVKAAEIFSEKNLSTLKGSEQARDWLITIMDKYSKEGEQYQGDKKDLSASIKENVQLIDALKKAKEIINGAQVGSFPYGLLNDKLDEIFDLKWSFTKLNFSVIDGFDHLLKQLKDPYHTVAKWSTNKNYPKAVSVKDDIISLLSLLDGKLKETQEALNEKQTLILYKNEHLNLINLYNSVSNLNLANNDLVTEMQNRESLAKRETIVIEEIKTISIDLGKVTEELDILVVSIDLLKPIAKLLTQNQSLSQLIGKIECSILDFNSASLLNKNQKELNQMLISARKQLTRIKESLPLVEDKIKLVEDKAIYNDNINKIKKLLGEGEEKISTFERNICTIKLDDLLQNIAITKKEILAIDTIISNQADNLYPIELLNQLLPKYLELFNETVLIAEKRGSLQIDLSNFVKNNLLVDADLVFDDLCKNVADIEPILLFQVIKSLDNLTADLLNDNVDKLAAFPIEQLKQLKISLELLKPSSDEALIKVNKLREGFVRQANIHINNLSDGLIENQQKITNLIVDETKLTQEANRNTLNEVSNYLNAVPLEQLDLVKASLSLLMPQTKNILTNLAKFSENFLDFTYEVKRADSINTKIVERIRIREEFVGRAQVELTNYQRARQDKYPVKDFFSKDLEVRNSFINDLSVLLTNYAESGKAKPVVDYINNNQFPGVNLQPIINRLKMNIKDHEAIQKDLVNHNDNYNRAASILRELLKTPKNHAFIDRIKVLNNKIDLINCFSASLDDSNEKTIARNLAKSLLQQVNIYVIENDKLAKKENVGDNEFQNLLDNFKSDFDCLLHSQDDVLSQHYSWKTIVANIGLAVLAVLTLSVSAWATYGFRGSVFFKADAIEFIDKVEETLNDVSAPVA
jgi:hypothetical protein